MAQLFPNHPNLRGGFAPLQMESDVHDLIIEGQVPEELNGTFYRNGPNPQYSPRGTYHMFGGDGMIHALSIENGRVGYRNRWVRTERFEKEREAGRALFCSFNPMDVDESVKGLQTDGVANTSIVWHADRLLVLEEAHMPIEIDPLTLQTKGRYSFGDKLHGPMTAHPKIDEQTGEMFFFGYNAKGGISEHMTFSVVDASGLITRSEAFVAPYASMVHDFIVTKEHILFPIMPLTGSLERALAGGPVYAWEPEKGVYIGVMPRNGSVREMRWFRGAPSYVFHPMNSYTQANKIICDVCEYPEAPLFPLADGTKGDPKKALAKMVRWTFDLDSESDTFKSEQLHDIVCEFPRFDERFTGLNYRHGYFAGDTQPAEKVGGFNVIGAVDHRTDTLDLYDVGAGCATGEPIFVPASKDAAEGEGFLLAHVYDANRGASHLAIMDAQNVADGPIAKAYLDHRIPYGFHGNWRSGHS
jgi:carotenoid cleavage dioxygenase